MTWGLMNAVGECIFSHQPQFISLGYLLDCLLAYLLTLSY